MRIISCLMLGIFLITGNISTVKAEACCETLKRCTAQDARCSEILSKTTNELELTIKALKDNNMTIEKMQKEQKKESLKTKAKWFAGGFLTGSLFILVLLLL